MAKRTAAGEAVTELILETFRLNGRLLAAGDRMTADLHLSSARWQVLGAIDVAAQTVARIARTMGLTRQAVQRIANVLTAEGFVVFQENPDHQRAKLVALTGKGRRTLDTITARQAAWANELAPQTDITDLAIAVRVLRDLNNRLKQAVAEATC